jgi:hypothetical protein
MSGQGRPGPDINRSAPREFHFVAQFRQFGGDAFAVIALNLHVVAGHRAARATEPLEGGRHLGQGRRIAGQARHDGDGLALAAAALPRDAHNAVAARLLAGRRADARLLPPATASTAVEPANVGVIDDAIRGHAGIVRPRSRCTQSTAD